MAGIEINTGFFVGSNEPLDQKYVQNTTSDMFKLSENGLAYEGMEVYCRDNKLKYRYDGTGWVEIQDNTNNNSFNESVEVNNAIGNLTSGTNLYGMDIKEIIKLMVTKEMPLWNGENIIWGITSMTPEELQSNPVLKIEDYNRETADGNLDYIRIDTTCTNQRFIFAVPYNCPLYKILDQNGLDCTDSYERVDITLDITSLGGFGNPSYIAYILKNTCSVNNFKNYLYFRDV